VRALAIIWSLWMCRNEKVFYDKNCSLQVIYRCTSMLYLWLPLQWLENRCLFTEVCIRFEATARDTFSLHGWRIIYGLVHHHPLRRFTIARHDMYFAFFWFACDILDGCVHHVYLLELLSNKALIIVKMVQDHVRKKSSLDVINPF
jgi:hypothetical protein